MHILITNIVMNNRTGTEVVVEQLVDGLKRAGHDVAVYTSQLGTLARKMRQRGHILVDRLDAVPFVPDVIHGHHNQTTMAAVAAFPGIPTLYLCHDATVSWDHAPRHPQIIRYLAVDELCRARLVADGIGKQATGLLLNAVDLERNPRRSPLPDRPGRGLVITKSRGYEEIIRKACTASDIELDCIGPGTGRVTDRLGDHLAGYDIVFATARSALEACVVGCGVVVCDMNGLAGFLTPGLWEKIRQWNIGRGALCHVTDERTVARAIAGYDPALASEATDRARKEADLADQITVLESIYRDMIRERVEMEDAPASMARYLEDMVPTLRTGAYWKKAVYDIHGPSSPLHGETLAADTLLNELEDRIRVINTMTSSLSWKLTRPFRLFRHFLKWIKYKML